MLQQESFLLVSKLVINNTRTFFQCFNLHKTVLDESFTYGNYWKI